MAKNRILEIIDGNGKSLYYPQYYQEVNNFFDKLLWRKKSKWVNYTRMRKQNEGCEFQGSLYFVYIVYNTKKESLSYLKGLKKTTKIHKLND